MFLQPSYRRTSLIEPERDRLVKLSAQRELDHAMIDRPTYYFRDFPELFWDAEPDAVIDTAHPEVIGRVLQVGRPEHIEKLLDMDTLRATWDRLWLPDHTRYVWGKVIEKTVAGRG